MMGKRSALIPTIPAEQSSHTADADGSDSGPSLIPETPVYDGMTHGHVLLHTGQKMEEILTKPSEKLKKVPYF